ncbi:PZF1 [Candida jiufengensis]|uniref:PZF1 n=1 Tax=Candida jiufengensis TaxID=497108 RepID=UPI0022245612|nr:PZF1 [Candida jiufengensis]KAI5951889.1 PZF1 [Candida jiufengensis]
MKEGEEEDTRSISSQISNLSTNSTTTLNSTTSKASSSSSSRPKRYLCTYENCDKAYNRPSLLDQHLRSHTGERPYPCSYPECTKSFLRKSHLDAHLISHSRDKPFHCSICGKGVNTSQHLKRHEITHTKSFKCTHEGCEESFYKHQSLRHHIQSVHEQSLTCSICNKVFARPSKLSAHKLKFHGESPAYQCDSTGCFKNFKTWSALQFHLKQEHPKLKCLVCGKGCVGKKGLKSHMLTHDDAIKIWKCNYCDLGKFNEKEKLIDHYNEFHDGNIPLDLLNNKITDETISDELMVEASNITESTSTEKPSTKTTTTTIKSLSTILSTEEESSDNFFNNDVRSDTAQALKSTNSMNSTLSTSINESSNISTTSSRPKTIPIDSNNIINIISKKLTKQIKCPKLKCDRIFERQHDLRRHLKWHDENLKRIENFLSGLEQEEQNNDEKQDLKKRKLNEVLDTDDDFNEDKRIKINDANDANEINDYEPTNYDNDFNDYDDDDADFDAILDREMSTEVNY